MKAKAILLLSFISVLFFSVNAQQLPNPSFDTWATDTLAPDGWSTYESSFGAVLGLAGKDAVDKIAGPNSLRITSDSVPGQPNYGVLSGVCALGAAAQTLPPSFSGKAFPYRPDTIAVLYKYTSPGADSAAISIRLTASGSSIIGHPVYGAGLLLPPTSAWTYGNVSITSAYTSSTTPDTLFLEIYSSKNPQPNGGIKGSVLHVDGLLFVYVNLPSSLKEVADRLNISLYPNPATNAITISTDENGEGFKFAVSDIMGNVVSVNNLLGNNTTIDVSKFASGTYIYRLADRSGNVLRQDKFSIAK